MISSALVSALHVFGIVITLGSVFFRGRALKALWTDSSDAAFSRVFKADNVWGISALVMISSGLSRAFLGLEKGSDFYLHNNIFWLKMIMFGLVFALELWPMSTLMSWRMKRAKGQTVDTTPVPRFYIINHIEMALVGFIIFAASFMARGIGA